MTKLSRRRFMHFAAAAAGLRTIVSFAWAQAYPTRPVRVIVPFPPGGVTDTIARPMAQWLSDRLHKPFIIENRPGAGTNIGTEAVMRAPPDGHTLLLASTANAINATLYDKLSFDFVRDVAPVAGIARLPIIMVVIPSFPATTVPEFISYAKANPGKINMASNGNGTAQHVVGEWFKMVTGVNMVHVPYRGGAGVLTDLLSGRVEVFFPDAFGAYVEHIKTGKLRALAVMGPGRLEVLPDIPRIDDFVSGLEASDWFGLVAPKNTPAEIIDKLNSEINTGLADAKLKARLADSGATMLTGSPAEFGKLIAQEAEKWGKVVKFAGIKLE
jgi:tripartite-type tricarboxylate transporter receptor subunit TctC